MAARTPCPTEERDQSIKTSLLLARRCPALLGQGQQSPPPKMSKAAKNHPVVLLLPRPDLGRLLQAPLLPKRPKRRSLACQILLLGCQSATTSTTSTRKWQSWWSNFWNAVPADPAIGGSQRLPLAGCTQTCRCPEGPPQPAERARHDLTGTLGQKDHCYSWTDWDRQVNGGALGSDEMVGGAQCHPTYEGRTGDMLSTKTKGHYIAC